MNREPESRGKRVDNGEWVYGSHHTNEAKDTHFILIPYILKWHPNAPEINCVGYNVIPSTVGEYIGFKDKHGKKGFEDDLYRDVDKGVWRIGWNEFYGKWMLFDLDDGTGWDEINQEEFGYGEIIGTIHDTEEQE